MLPALTILILAPEYFLPIRQVGANYHATLDGQIAMEQMEEILQKQKDVSAHISSVKMMWDSSSSMELKEINVCNDET